jgi:hypothetical protein
VQLALNNIVFEEQSSTTPLHHVLDFATTEAKTKKLLLVIGRSRRLATESHQTELKQIFTEKNSSIGTEIRNTLGDVATAFIAGGVNANILVMQASSR